MTDTKNVPNWAKELTEPKSDKKEVFKLKEGTKQITFLSDGKKWHDEVYDRDWIIYDILCDNKEYVWFASGKAYGLLRQIADLGFPLKQKKVLLSRIGKGKLDTRWSITTPNEE